MQRAHLDDFLSDLTSAVSKVQVWAAGQRYLDQLGFDLSCYQFGNWDVDPTCRYTALYSHSFDWTEAHMSNLTPAAEPLLAMGCLNYTPMFMGSSFMPKDVKLPKAFRPFFEQLADNRIHSAMTFPMRLRNERGPFGAWALSQIGLGGQAFKKLALEQGDQARLACFYMHEKLEQAAPCPESAGLTPRQADCLLYLSRGLRQAQVAEKLGVSVVTVEFHLRAARKSLKAKTNEEALAKAITQSIIAP